MAKQDDILHILISNQNEILHSLVSNQDEILNGLISNKHNFYNGLSSGTCVEILMTGLHEPKRELLQQAKFTNQTETS